MSTTFAQTPAKPVGSNAECRDIMPVRGQNKAGLEYARKWWSAQPSAESATCLASMLTPFGEIREAETVLRNVDPDKLDPITQGDFYAARSAIADSLGRSNAAIEFAKKSQAAYAKDPKAKDFAAGAHLYLSDLLFSDDEEADAELHLKSAEKLCAAAWCKALIALSRAHRERGDDAKKSYAEASTLFEKINDQLAAAWIAIALVDVHIAEERFSDAEKALARARGLQQQIGARGLDADLLRARGDLLAAQGKPRQARERLEQAISLARELGMNDLAKRALSSLNDLSE
ncbi:MAG: tetratricopeptide repeat protein [Casimicrobium sp.]